MSLVGPRLDRPSAIGEEGRPRAASLRIATLAVIVVGIAAGTAVGDPSIIATLGTVAGLTVAGLALLERSSFVQLVVGHAFLVTFGSAFVLFVLVGPFGGRNMIVLVGLTIALFGMAAAWADVDADGLKRGGLGTLLTFGSMIAFGVVAVVVAALSMFGLGLLSSLTGASSAIASAGGILVVVAVTGCVLALSLRWLPLRQLTPRSKRPALEARLDSATRGLFGAVVGSLLLLFVSAMAWLAGVFDRLLVAVPGLESALVALSSPLLVWPPVAVGGCTLLVGLGSLLLGRLTRHTDQKRWMAAVVVGFAIVVAAFGIALLVLAGIITARPELFFLPVSVGPLAIVLVVLGPLAFLLLVAVLLAGVALDVVPNRAFGPAIAAAGLVVAAIGLAGSQPPVAVACLGAAVVAWDVSTYGLGLTAELGHRPRTRRLELLYGLASILVAGVVVALAVGLEFVRSGVFADVGSPAAIVVAGLGVLFLLVPLRG